jgi:hypothetical protein
MMITDGDGDESETDADVALYIVRLLQDTAACFASSLCPVLDLGARLMQVVLQ